MKKQTLFSALMYIIALFVITPSAFAQNQDKEYREALKKIMMLSSATAMTENMLPQILSMAKLASPHTDDAYWDNFAKNWKEKIENIVLDTFTPIYQRHMTLEDMNATIAFYESPAGQKLGKATPVIMSEAMPVIQKLCGEMIQELMESQQALKVNRPTPNFEDKNRKADQKMYDEAYYAPKDSIKLSDLPYQPGVTAPTLYSIERRKHDTRVTFSAPIYFDWQWLHYSPGFKIIDKKSGDEYNVRGYDGGTPFGKLLIIEGFNKKCIYVSLLFPKLKKSVKEIDILELPHEKDVLPSNDDGIAKTFRNVIVKDYVPSKKKSSKVYN